MTTENKIKCVLMDFEINRITLQEATKQILLLLNVVGQSEQLKWKEIQSNKVRVFQLGEEPEIVYLIKIRENEYMATHEDGYDQNTGKVEFLNKEQVSSRFGINIP